VKPFHVSPIIVASHHCGQSLPTTFPVVITSQEADGSTHRHAGRVATRHDKNSRVSCSRPWGHKGLRSPSPACFVATQATAKTQKNR
jgi:hypothetical protein